MTKEPLFYFHQKSVEGLIYSSRLFRPDFLKYELATISRTVYLDSQTGDICGNISELEFQNNILYGIFVPIRSYVRPKNTVIRGKGMALSRWDNYMCSYIISSFIIVDKELDIFRNICIQNHQN